MMQFFDARQLVRLEGLLARLFNTQHHRDLYRMYAAMVTIMLEHDPPTLAGTEREKITPGIYHDGANGRAQQASREMTMGK